MPVEHNTKDLIQRLIDKRGKMTPGSPEMAAAFNRIGMLVVARAKLIVRQKGMIDSGRLLNSLRYEIEKKGDTYSLVMGSFGVPYAALNEFGGPFTSRMRRAMFYHMKRRGGPPRPSKGVITGQRYKARPYLRPAVRESRTSITEIMQGVYRGDH